MPAVFEGGPSAYVILGFALVTILILLMLAGLAIAKKRIPLAVMVLFPATLLGVSALASWWVAGDGINAVVADDTTTSATAAVSTAAALVPDWLGRWVGALLFAIGAWAAGLGALLGVGPDRSWTLHSSLLALMATLVGVIGCTVYAAYNALPVQVYMLVALLFFAGLGAGLGAARRALHEHAHRVAALRFTAGVNLVLAVFMARSALVVDGRMLEYTVLATSPEMEVYTQLIDSASMVSNVGWAALVFAGLIALCVFFEELGDVVAGGTLLDIGATLGIFVVLGGTRLIQDHRVDSLDSVARSGPVVSLLAELGSDVPSTSVVIDGEIVETRPAPLWFGDVLAYGGVEWVRVARVNGIGWTSDQAPVSGGLSTERPPLAIAKSGSHGKALLTVLDATPDGRAVVLMRAGEFPKGSMNDPVVDRLRTLQATSMAIQKSNGEPAYETELWMTAKDLRPHVGAMRWFGEGEESRDLLERVGNAMAATKAQGMHVSVSSGDTIRDVLDACLPVVVDKTGAPSGKWCALTERPEDELYRDALARWQAPPARTQVMGSRDSVIEAAVTQRVSVDAPAFDACVDAGQAAGQPSTGPLVLEVIVNRRGRVEDIAVDPRQSRVTEGSAVDCVQGRIQSMVFSGVPLGDSVKVPLRLELG